LCSYRKFFFFLDRSPAPLDDPVESSFDEPELDELEELELDEDEDLDAGELKSGPMRRLGELVELDARRLRRLGSLPGLLVEDLFCGDGDINPWAIRFSFCRLKIFLTVGA
jgi:hypothetical protein